MEIGQFVDFCIEWNDWNNPDEKKEQKRTTTRRKATQADWDMLLG